MKENPDLALEIEGEVKALVFEETQLDPDPNGPESGNGDEEDPQ